MSHLGACGRCHQGGHAGGVEACDREHLAPSSRVAQHGRDGMVRADLGVPVGTDDRHRVRRQLGGHEAEEEERRLVGPVQVVEHDQQGAGPCRPAEERRDGVEEAEAGLLGFELWRRRRVVQARCQFWQQAQDVAGARPQMPRQLLVIDAAGVRPQGLDPRPEGGRPLALPARAPEHARAKTVGVGRAVDGEAGLADARFAGEEDDAASAGRGPVDRAAEGGDLGVSSEEGGIDRSCSRGRHVAFAPDDLVQDPRALETLEAHGAALPELQPCGAGQLADEVRRQDLAAARVGHDPGGGAHGGAVDVVVLVEDLAGVKAHADPWSLFLFGELSLDGARALEGAPRRGEGDKEAVAHGLDLPPAEALEGGADNGFLPTDEVAGCRVPQAALQVRRSLDVGHQDRDRSFGLSPRRHRTIVSRRTSTGRDALGSIRCCGPLAGNGGGREAGRRGGARTRWSRAPVGSRPRMAVGAPRRESVRRARRLVVRACAGCR